jgi:hypothetical protein
VSLVSIVIYGGSGVGTRWMLWSEDVGPKVVDLLFFPDFVNKMW